MNDNLPTLVPALRPHIGLLVGTVVHVLFITDVMALPLRPEVGLGFRHEPGVETRLLVSCAAGLDLASWADATATLAFAGIDNPGLAHYGLGSSVVALRNIGLEVELAANHDQWSDWRVGENRFSGLIRAVPRPDLELGIGLARRYPLIDSLGFCSPFHWTSASPEWNLLYRLAWKFQRSADETLSVWLANSDRYRLDNPQELPFGLSASIRRHEQLWLTLRLGTDIKGFSSLLPSLGEVNFTLGARFAQ